MKTARLYTVRGRSLADEPDSEILWESSRFRRPFPIPEASGWESNSYSRLNRLFRVRYLALSASGPFQMNCR
jgi:hypothetical protein